MLRHRYFPVSFVKFLRTPPFLQNTSGGCSVINGMLWRSNTGDLLFHLRYPIKCVKFIRFSLRPPRLGLLLMQFCFSHIRHVYSPSFWYIESWIPVQNVWETVPRKCSLKNVLLKYLQNLQEKTCVGVSFFNATLLKKKTPTQVFSFEILQNF